MNDEGTRVRDCMRAIGMKDVHIAAAIEATNMALGFLQAQPATADRALATLVAGGAAVLANLLMDHPDDPEEADKPIAPVYARIVNEILAATSWRLVEVDEATVTPGLAPDDGAKGVTP